MSDRLGPNAIDAGFDVPLYALGAVVYVERGDEILLLKRAEGSALAGQWFLPGGAIERDELPEDGARRELQEEAGIEIDGDLELIGAYPIHAYGLDMVQLSYRGRVADDAEVTSAMNTMAPSGCGRRTCGSCCPRRSSRTFPLATRGSSRSCATSRPISIATSAASPEAGA